MDYEEMMHLAIEQAKKSGEDVPVGAILVDSHGSIVARAHNRKEMRGDPTAHAEIEVIREACSKRGDWRLLGHTLVVTLEPCVMCAGAILASRIPKVIFGAWDESSGASGSAWDLLRDSRTPGQPLEVISAILENECTAILRDFFSSRRLQQN